MVPRHHPPDYLNPQLGEYGTLLEKDYISGDGITYYLVSRGDDGAAYQTLALYLA